MSDISDPTTDDEGTSSDTGDGTDATEEKKAPDFEAEAKKWKALALKHEKKATANAEAEKRLKEIELSGKSETEKLQALLNEARAEASTAKVQSLKLQVAADKNLPPQLAKFLPDVDDEVDMMAAADELLEAAGVAGSDSTGQARQPKSNLTSPLADDTESQRDRVIAAMTGQSPL